VNDLLRDPFVIEVVRLVRGVLCFVPFLRPCGLRPEDPVR